MLYPYKLWSQLDMFKINALHYVQVGNFLRAVSDNLSTRANFSGMLRDADRLSLDDVLPPFEIKFLLEKIQQVLSHCKALELDVSVQALNEIHKNLANPSVEWTWRQAQNEFVYWSRTFKYELNNRLFFYIPSHRAAFYKNNLLDEDSRNKLPSSVRDELEDAGNCYVMEDYTACVFHLMRVMETGINKLAEAIGVALTNQTAWDGIIKEIQQGFNTKYPKNHHDMARGDMLLGKLALVKDAWRNPTMLPKATYKESDAMDILMSVKTFMNELAKFL